MPVPYSMSSDASDEESVTVSGYTVYHLGAANLKANKKIINEFLNKFDIEHNVIISRHKHLLKPQRYSINNFLII